MLKWLLGLLRGGGDSTGVLSLDDPDFGTITFDGNETGIWQTAARFSDSANHANYGFTAIPGDRSGPFSSARQFLLGKKNELPELWRICTPALEEVCGRFKAQGLALPVTNQFVLSSIALEDDFETSRAWEVAFETNGAFWVFVAVRIIDGNASGFTCDT